jgi:hypothetical protein
MAPPAVRLGSNRAGAEVIEISDDEPDCTGLSKVDFPQSATNPQDRSATVPMSVLNNARRPSTTLGSNLGRSIYLPRLPSMQSAYELEEEDNPESKNSVLVDGKSYGDRLKHTTADRSVSPRLVMSLQSLSSGKFNIDSLRHRFYVSFLYLYFTYTFNVPLLILCDRTGKFSS